MPIIEQNEINTTLSTECIFCKRKHTIKVPTKSYKEYVQGTSGRMVQNIFIHLTPAERELFFVSGICDDCWNNTFKEEDDEEDIDTEE